ncbi:hypothetical protein CIP107572_02431 [Corynebacterium diphtheriae]|nr:hypothetical protein CIP107537_00113 [Corynebacterium diphtheriae]CAB0671235.1 hypothetical protein CIP107572_02431 [Corynebacterium diphtheriae]CAB0728713.1 hypothetical protein FRC0137_00036 [Corynebacterium diphtheriae]CAB0784707.1 hypothetical protein FRC0209_00110 [Corynebacterium diphtheriae]CAB0850405.1 hypothetical protein FRC0323_01465 [Corynebacterium diphtheriae]
MHQAPQRLHRTSTALKLTKEHQKLTIGDVETLRRTESGNANHNCTPCNTDVALIDVSEWQMPAF